MSTTPPSEPRNLLQRAALLPLRLLKGLLGGVLALLILFEEWGWGPLHRVMAWVGQLPGLRWLEARITQLPPYGALAIFALPTLLLLPVKLLALWLMGHHHVLLGTLVILTAKVAGTAVVARLFTLTHATLMQLAWFARLYHRWVRWKDHLLQRVRASRPWRWARVVKRHIRRALHALWRRLRGAV